MFQEKLYKVPNKHKRDFEILVRNKGLTDNEILFIIRNVHEDKPFETFRPKKRMLPQNRNR
ncbi:MAG: hypothetical protein FWG63_02990 [Defluviitaleaceae bacterium]|nr:hypothetical protein [Defluviitaleaceae bacterium]